MTKPYLPGLPVKDGRLFVGRDPILNDIVAYLSNNQSVSIVGPRKIGKTSLLLHLMRHDTRSALGIGEDELLVYHDCEIDGCSSDLQVFARFCQEMLTALNARSMRPEPALESAVANPSHLSFESAVRKLSQRGIQSILILDHFEQLSTKTHFNVGFLNALRSTAGRYQLAYLTASSRPLLELTYLHQRDEILSSPFFNIFATQFLGLLEEDEARSLIRGLMKAAGIVVASDTEDFIYDLAGGHPLTLQVACSHACEVAHDLVEIERRTINELENDFHHSWNSLQHIEQKVLCDLSDSYVLDVSETVRHMAAQSLVKQCLLVRAQGRYQFSSRAWAEFVANRACMSDER